MMYIKEFTMTRINGDDSVDNSAFITPQRINPSRELVDGIDSTRSFANNHLKAFSPAINWAEVYGNPNATANGEASLLFSDFIGG
jgi:hypothetical protein